MAELHCLHTLTFVYNFNSFDYIITFDYNSDEHFTIFNVISFFHITIYMLWLVK